MPDSPRARRLKNDYVALTKLQQESSIFRFRALSDPRGERADYYSLHFYGPGLKQDTPQSDVQLLAEHEVHVRLGAGYPRMMPELSWKSPIFHPNISASGVVCLGGYGTNWVPSLMLDDLCIMLWDMIRMENYDENSPYNREAAKWLKYQYEFKLPLDPRSLRDLVGSTVDTHRLDPPQPILSAAQPPVATAATTAARTIPREANSMTDILQRIRREETQSLAQDQGVFFLDENDHNEIVDAELIEDEQTPGDSGILFIN